MIFLSYKLDDLLINKKQNALENKWSDNPISMTLLLITFPGEFSKIWSASVLVYSVILDPSLQESYFFPKTFNIFLTN